MAKRIVRESQGSYIVQLKSNEPLDKPFIIKRNGKRVGAFIPLAEYKQFVAWKEKQRDSTTTARRARGPRKRKRGNLTNLIGIIQAEPSGEKIDFSKFMNKHGYEQIDRDDS